MVNFNAVGGSTILYTAHFPRLHPSDFRVRTLDGVADDWPIDYATLEPFFAENDRMMGVSGLAGDPAYPPKQPPMPPLPLGKLGARFGKAMNRLGWHWWPSDSAIATTEYEGRAPLHQPRPLHARLRAGREGAAPTSPTGRTPSAPASSCARAAACARSPSTRTAWRTASIYYDADGVEQFQPAEVVVVACNGIGTPRLLLNSASSDSPTAWPIPAGWSART